MNLLIWQVFFAFFKGLVDFCASYEIALRLHGTEGTTPAEQILETLKPVKSNNDLLLRAKSSGYQFEIKKTDTIPNVDVFYKTKNSIVLHWNNTTEENDDVCFDGYHIKLLDENDCTHLEQLVPNEMEMALFTGTDKFFFIFFVKFLNLGTFEFDCQRLLDETTKKVLSLFCFSF